MSMFKQIEDVLQVQLGVPRGAEHQKLIIYKGWNVGGLQRGRFQYIYNNKTVSYFLHIGASEVRVFLPSNTGNDYDMMIEYK